MCEDSNLLSQVGPLQCDHAHVHRIRDEGFVVHEFVRGEGGDGVQEQLSRLLEVPDGHAVEALIHLQTIPPVPVTALLNQTTEEIKR